MTVLCDLAFLYGSDKCPQVKHHFTQGYHALFGGRRESVRKVVEIGIESGASLRMWRDYFPNATVYGADIRPESLVEEERIHSILCDQASAADLDRLLEMTGTDVDLWVDDGSHNPDQQVFTCRYVLPKLQAGAVYVIEDVGKPQITDALAQEFRVTQYRRKATWDDRMLIVRRDG